MIYNPGRREWAGARFHCGTQDSVRFKTFAIFFFISGNCHLIFSDCSWPQLTETSESEIKNHEGLLYKGKKKVENFCVSRIVVCIELWLCTFSSPCSWSLGHILGKYRGQRGGWIWGRGSLSREQGLRLSVWGPELCFLFLSCVTLAMSCNLVSMPSSVRRRQQLL